MSVILLVALLFSPSVSARPHDAVVPVATHDPEGRLKRIEARLATQPNSPGLLYTRGELHRAARNYSLALRDFRRVESLRPDWVGAVFARAWTHRALGQHAEALQAAQRYLARRPDAGLAHLLAARCLRRLGRHDDAAKAFDRALPLLSRLTPEHFIEQARAHALAGSAGRRRAVACLRRGIARLGPALSLCRVAEEFGLDVAALPGPSRAPSSGVTPPTAPSTFLGETVLIPFGATWRYLDDGSDQGTGWTAPSFDDSAWASGPAELGYGDGDEATVIRWGSDPKNRHTTTYFRCEFQLPSVAAIQRARMSLVRDDGAVIYLNGTEIARSNMSAGIPNYKTLAERDIGITIETERYRLLFDHRLLRAGRNVVAVEVHQSKPNSDDLSFDLEMRSSDGFASIERGPYLQSGRPTGATIRWRTDYNTETAAFLGTSPANLTVALQRNVQATEHTAVLTGLTPDTLYYYGIGNASGILASGPGYFFRTPPATGTAKKTRIWALGDSGTGDRNAAAVRDAYRAFAANTPTDVLLMLGDNAYPFGTDADHQVGLFDMYPEELRRMFLWPTYGNHESYTSDSGRQTGSYYKIFNLPKAGESGGLPSGTEAYYSFDHGNIHFICLNSADVDRGTLAPMMTWMRADLQEARAKRATWVIAYWHHPPYSKGSHDSDAPTNPSENEMRAIFLPALEQVGVDLVLCGHSHSYERSYLLDQHYGKSPTLQPGMILDRGDGGAGSHGAYTKPTLGMAGNEGTVYTVAGSSGQVTLAPLNHPAMVVSTATLGSLVIDIEGNELDLRFLTSTGAVLDHFTLRKGVSPTLSRDQPTISLSTGGSQSWSLDAGGAQANQFYRMAGSFGVTPGFALGNVLVPLNVDPWFQLTLSLANTARMPGALGTLDAQGRAQARLVLPPLQTPSAIGTRLHHAYIVYDAGSVRMASNPVSVTLVR